VVGSVSGGLLALELEALLLFELEALLALELEVRLALELGDWFALELEVWLALEVEDERVEDACVEDGYLAGLEKLAGRLRPLLLAHVSGSTSFGQHRPPNRQ